MFSRYFIFDIKSENIRRILQHDIVYIQKKCKQSTFFVHRSSFQGFYFNMQKKYTACGQIYVCLDSFKESVK